MPSASPAGPRGEANPGTEWLLEDQAQVGFARVAAKTRDSRFLGTYVDWERRELVAVLSAHARAEQGRYAREFAADSPSAAVRVAASCHSKTDLESAVSDIASRSWHPRASTTPIGVGLAPELGRALVRLPESAADLGRELELRFGTRVAVQYGLPEQLPDYAGNRLGDTSAHWAGAALGTRSNPDFCTSGFTMSVNDSGVQRRWGLTAGHCFLDGTSAYSGSAYFGVTKHRRYGENQDTILIGSGVETYTNRIHVDPGPPVMRDVVGVSDNWDGQGICTSGYRTRAKCGAVVRHTNFILCGFENNRCLRTTIATKAGDPIAQPGDSGGPMYGRPGTGTADVRGLIYGGPCSGPCEEVWGLSPSNILAAYSGMNPSFVTSP